MSDTEEQEERELKKDLMTIQIERLKQEVRMEQRKFYVQVAVAVAGILAATAAMAGIILAVAHIIR